mgnify:CR=1 FL=1
MLVTGGAGFIGSNFVHHWLRHPGDERLVVLDALTYAGNLSNLDGLRTDPTKAFYQGQRDEFRIYLEDPFKQLLSDVAEALPWAVSLAARASS